jgi:hypothetical protein
MTDLTSIQETDDSTGKPKDILVKHTTFLYGSWKTMPT